MVKATQKQPLRNSFVLVVFRSILKNQRLPTERETKTTLSAITYHSRRLLSYNIIRKIGVNTGVYKTDLTEKEAIKIIKSNTKKKIVTTKTTSRTTSKYKRLHNIQAKVSIPRFNYWFSILTKYLTKKDIKYKINKKGQYRIIIPYKGFDHKILLCRNMSILLYLPTGLDWISDNTEVAMHQAEAHIKGLLAAFSKYFGKDIRIKGEFIFEITRKHIAMMDNIIAKKMRKKKQSLSVWIDGKQRVITDHSFNFDELEAVNNKEAITDVRAMELFIQDVIANKETLSDIRRYTDQEVRFMLDKIRMQNQCIALLSDSQEKTNKILAKLLGERGFTIADFTK